MDSNRPQSTNIIYSNLSASVVNYQTNRLNLGKLLSNQRRQESQDALGVKPGGAGWRTAKSAPICSEENDNESLKFHPKKRT